MGEEGEGELHARVEEEVDEVGQAYLPQVSLLLLLHVCDAGKPEELQGVEVVICLGEDGGCTSITPASREGLLGWKDKTNNDDKNVIPTLKKHAKKMISKTDKMRAMIAG